MSQEGRWCRAPQHHLRSHLLRGIPSPPQQGEQGGVTGRNRAGEGGARGGKIDGHKAWEVPMVRDRGMEKAAEEDAGWWKKPLT